MTCCTLSKSIVTLKTGTGHSPTVHSTVPPVLIRTFAKDGIYRSLWIGVFTTFDIFIQGDLDLIFMEVEWRNWS